MAIQDDNSVVVPREKNIHFFVPSTLVALPLPPSWPPLHIEQFWIQKWQIHIPKSYNSILLTTLKILLISKFVLLVMKIPPKIFTILDNFPKSLITLLEQLEES